MMKYIAVLTQYRNVTDRQTDRQVAMHNAARKWQAA